MDISSVNLNFLFGLERDGASDVVRFCMDVGLISNGYECPKCKESMELRERKDVSDGFCWCCRKFGGENAHFVKRSPRCGSWFEESRLRMIDILKLTYMWISQCKCDFISYELKISKNTVTDWMSFCREVCVEALVKESVALGGPGYVIEIDESKFSKRKYNRGMRVEGKWVLGGVERGSNKCFVEVVPDRTRVTLLAVLKRRVLPGSVVVSDCWKAYDCLNDEDFIHFTVNHSVTFKDPDTAALSNTTEGMWNCIKRSLRGGRHCKGQFDSYLAEFMWRRLYKDEPTPMFQSFCNAIINVYPPKIRDDNVEILESDGGDGKRNEAVDPQPGCSGESSKNIKKYSLRRKFDNLRTYYIKESKKMKSYNDFNQSSFLQDDTFEEGENNSAQSISVSDVELDFEVENNDEVDMLNIKQESPDDTYKIVSVSSCRDLNLSPTDEKDKMLESLQDLPFSKEPSKASVKERNNVRPMQQIQSNNHQPKSPTQNSEENTDDLYGKFIASKLQEIKDPMQRDLARIEIQNVLIKFKYKVNTLHNSTSCDDRTPKDSI